MKLEEIMEYFEPSLYEMSNFRSKTTGLPNDIKLWVRTEPTGLPHTKYRVKFDHPQKGSAVFAIWGDDALQVEGDWKVKGKELRKIQSLVKLNVNSLRKHIDGEEDSADLTMALQSNKPIILKS